MVSFYGLNNDNLKNHDDIDTNHKESELTMTPHHHHHVHGVISLCSTTSNASLELENLLDILLQDAETSAANPHGHNEHEAQPHATPQDHVIDQGQGQE